MASTSTVATVLTVTVTPPDQVGPIRSLVTKPSAGEKIVCDGEINQVSSYKPFISGSITDTTLHVYKHTLRTKLRKGLPKFFTEVHKDISLSLPVVITITVVSPTTRSSVHTLVSLQVIVSLILIMLVVGRETVLSV